jgi:glycosyltransferase involved in cell wall biosynthesis
LLARSTLRVVPSAFLQRVFDGQGLGVDVIPNVVELARFATPPAFARHLAAAPLQVLVSRNLEAIYGLDTAIRAFARVQLRLPGTRLVVAGSGVELVALQALVAELQLGPWVDFVGRIANADMPARLAQAHCLLNPSRVDNQPVSILEALAAGVPVLSTRAGGIPDMLQHGHSALLVAVDDEAAMAEQLLRILQDPALALRLAQAGRAEAEKYRWERVQPLWRDAYQRALCQSARSSARAPGVRP